MYRATTLSALVFAAAEQAGLKAAGTAEKCYLPSDIVILQDTTGSFMDDMPLIRGQIPILIDRVAASFPGTKFGIAEFRDKPYFPMGESDDFCYKLRFGELTDDAKMLQFAWDILDPSGGGDFYEAQFQAGIDLVTDDQIGWREFAPGAYNTTTHRIEDQAALTKALEEGGDGKVGAHVVILITDAEPHLPGDMTMCAPGSPGWAPDWNCPQGLPANPGMGTPFDDACSNYEYPSEAQFIQAAQHENAMFFFLTTNKVSSFWTGVNSRLGQPAEFHQEITENSSNFAATIIQALQSLAEIACPQVTTTTPVPTTTVVVPTSGTAASPTPPTSTPPPTTPVLTPPTATSPTPPTTTPPATTTAATTTATTESTAPETPASSYPASWTPPATTTTKPETAVVTTAGSPVTTRTPTPPGGACPCPCPCPGCCAGCGHCDELVVKLGPAIKELHLDYEA